MGFTDNTVFSSVHIDCTDAAARQDALFFFKRLLHSFLFHLKRSHPGDWALYIGARSYNCNAKVFLFSTKNDFSSPFFRNRDRHPLFPAIWNKVDRCCGLIQGPPFLNGIGAQLSSFGDGLSWSYLLLGTGYVRTLLVLYLQTNKFHDPCPQTGGKRHGKISKRPYKENIYYFGLPPKSEVLLITSRFQRGHWTSVWSSMEHLVD